jgi:sulfate transport system ATP-binding protein
MNLQQPATSESVTVKSVSKRYSSFPALNDVSLEIAPGEFMALLGPSGSGKTTLLRVIAGLEVPGTGQVLFGDREVTRVPVAQRGIGFVFQHYALFGHMTVGENIAFGLTVMRRSGRPSRSRITERVAELLTLVQLEGYEKRYPSQLSGGQRQRIALARALARRPSILLLDEPFGALDAKVRRELRTALRTIHEEVGLTSVFVTHDHEEAFALADRITVMSNGVIEEVCTPEQLRSSTNAFVRHFLE